MLRNTFWFFVGVAITGLLMSRGIDLPQRISDAINWRELKTIGEDIWESAQ
ncbi:hypothetical protein AM10699_56690 (plasmid) [Acaryochloris marina MBIC10699]|nr:hypothetical protein AM10699_56690 [Acaryochloris marina MBIC10699]